MKLLLFSDIHCSQSAARQLLEKAKDADVVVGAGDFANLRRGLRQIIDQFKGLSKPTVLVPGNSESLSELDTACQGWPEAIVLHGTGTTIDQIEFFGLGGGVPVTPFGSWSWDFTEEAARRLLTDCPEDCVLVCHSPPKGILDISSHGESLGSTAVRDAITEKRPRLVVCGHIHESSGAHAKTGTTSVVNAGPAGLVWDLNAGQPA